VKRIAEKQAPKNNIDFIKSAMFIFTKYDYFLENTF